MTAEINQESLRGCLTIDLEGEADIAHLQGNIANPEGIDLLITDAFLYIITNADAAALWNLGIGASGADLNDLMSAFDMNAPAHGMAWNVVAKVASEAAMTTPAIWHAEDYLTMTSSVAASTGLTAKLFLKYIPLE